MFLIQSFEKAQILNLLVFVTCCLINCFALRILLLHSHVEFPVNQADIIYVVVVFCLGVIVDE